jgi:dihydrolipoamide dehydrogenase
MEKYDLCVIGGGPAGYAAAMRAIDFGKKVVLIEKDKIGGAGIYNGALTSKTLWELSEKVAAVNENIVHADSKRYDITWEDVMKTMNEAIFDRKFQYSLHMKLLKTETLSKLFSYERGFGSFINNNVIKITNDNNVKEIYADYTVIATGSRPRTLPNLTVDEKIIMTSDGIHQIAGYPKSLVILGAGVIGCEFATIFSNFGKTKVYLIDRANRILPFEDEDIAGMVADNFESKGCTVHREAKLNRMEIVDGEVEYEVEKALLSIGRQSNVEGLNLEAAGVQLNANGTHIANNDTQTTAPNIFVAGDVSGHIALVNVGEVEARHAVEKMFSKQSNKLSYDNISTIMFLMPEVATVGMSEQQCVEKNIPVKVVKIDYSCIARAIAMRRTTGFFKIIVTNDDEMKILGMRAIGTHASSAIQAVALLIKMNKGIEELSELVHPHPSIIEGIQECVRMLLNKSIFKSSVFKDKLKCYSLVGGIKTPLERL